jgi:hypothetical protein
MAAELVYRLAILVDVRRFHGMGAADSRSLQSDTYVLCNMSFVDLLMFPFDGFWGDVPREFLQRLYAALQGTLGCFLRDALHYGSVDVVACLHMFLGFRHVGFFSFLPFCLVMVSTSSSCQKFSTWHGIRPPSSLHHPSM